MPSVWPGEHRPISPPRCLSPLVPGGGGGSVSGIISRVNTLLCNPRCQGLIVRRARVRGRQSSTPGKGQGGAKDTRGKARGTMPGSHKDKGGLQGGLREGPRGPCLRLTLRTSLTGGNEAGAVGAPGRFVRGAQNPWHQAALAAGKFRACTEPVPLAAGTRGPGQHCGLSHCARPSQSLRK